MAHYYDWITVASIATNLEAGSKEQTIKHLVQLLKKTDKVEDEALVERDILTRESIESTQISDYLTVPHAHTNGVKEFCVSLGVVQKKEIYMLIAWDTMNYQNLKMLARLIEAVNDVNNAKAIIAAKNSQEIYDLLMHAMK